MNTRENSVDQSDRLREKCAVFGIYGAKNAAKLTYYGLWALQHRGQESSGIASSDGKALYRHSAFGLVANVYTDEDLATLKGTTAIGHNRYSTNGGADPQFNQPYVSNNRVFTLAHNGNLPLVDKLSEFLSSVNIDHAEMNDSGMMTAAIDHELGNGATIDQAVTTVFPLLEGAFSVTAVYNEKLIAFRDQYGIRPLSLAKLDGGYVVASETCAFDTIGAEFIRDIEPGELVVIDESGVTSHQIVKPDLKFDIFELVYFARPDSVLMGKTVSSVREKYGIQLAKEYQFDADIVVPVPDSSIPAALGYAKASGIPFEMALIKNRYINRTFISPTQELRERDVMLKLNPIIDLLKDKKIVLIDDSIVRGTTMKKVVKMLRGVGVKEINLLISSPPVKYPDFYGIDTPSQDDLIASRMSTKEIRQWLGVDWLGYLSYDGMIEATGVSRDQLCTSCFDGNYPSPIGRRADEIRFVEEKIATGAYSHSAEDDE
ncbi:MAG TPA: amidophosphoribosyltransferase [Candidatus Saccharimonadales bacterium]